MWSGPRNISTAMMRSWENRPDTQVVDEPFYGFYLKKTGIEHPSRDAILRSMACEWSQVVDQISTAPVSSSIFYQKHMTHHMLVGYDMSWTKKLRHCFLIRDPELVVNSYVRTRPDMKASDVGIQRQAELFTEITELTGHEPPIIDTGDVLQDPRTILNKLCAALELPFSESMLHWPAGKRDSDGVWAPHWYQNVEQSTTFSPYEAREIKLSTSQSEIVQMLRPYYLSLFAKRIRP